MSKFDISHLCYYACKGREYVIRNKKRYVELIDEDEYEVVYEDNPNWDGSGVLMVILDNKEPITLQMLKQKRVELEDNERFRLLRALRDKLLSETDYVMNADYPHKEGMLDKWKQYRQALRDLPYNSNPTLNEKGELDMNSITLPIRP
jgi:hypothetical protein